MLPIGLSFQQAPPISVPFRFFLTAPLFLLAAAALLAIWGPELVGNPHGAAALAATHLITLGFTSMVMCGALLQLLPVLGGIPLCHPRRKAWLIHVPLTAGALALPGAFLWHSAALFILAAASLSLGLGCFAVWIASALWKIHHGGASIQGMRAALVALVVTWALGLTLGAALHGTAPSIPYAWLAPLHPLWGLGGWTSLLIMGLAYQLIPMFQLTTPYPARMTRWLIPGLLLLLVAKTLIDVMPSAFRLALSGASDWGIAGGFLWFSGTTWRLLARRRRKVHDVSLQFWRLGLGLLIIASTLAPMLSLYEGALSAQWQLTVGVLMLTGFVLSVIQGMLYKIVPFLTWFHLQSAYPAMGIVPNVREIHARFHGEKHLALFSVALALLVASCWFPAFSRVAGMLWMIHALWLEASVLQAAHIFLKVGRVARMREVH